MNTTGGITSSDEIKDLFGYYTIVTPKMIRPTLVDIRIPFDMDWYE